MAVRYQLVLRESLGATRLSTASQDGLDHYAVAMADPEGNEFDVF